MKTRLFMDSQKMFSVAVAAMITIMAFSTLGVETVSALPFSPKYSSGGTLVCMDSISGKVYCKLIYSIAAEPNNQIQFSAWLYTYYSPSADEYDVSVYINEKVGWWIFWWWTATGDWQPNPAYWYTRNKGPETLYYSKIFYDANTAQLKEYQIVVKVLYISYWWQQSSSVEYYWQL